jgi:hypothetical protein|mmetsp:Transcript_19731/g.30428  ORF Transcript_19731/g.30428 Transcript_19731/m.30428 type:complete len:386 (-) Transcript_19731:164-1321(-)|eukprot:CAMPEP_0195294906 /NCGR_PEP_ID=MMETSP0707-20130614/16168_1 /TAXON_ID=33640 /ORGANISM="Asterionellopsis glacialis, Strain CCMP134" /LENGTH=385 /DNA_ID=CAMNT_0040355995 /DNA_START=119 /DNA_END=1276 /DNA_ORIENTATION=-
MAWNGNGKDNDNSRGGTSGVGEPLVSRKRPTREQRLQEMKIIEEIMKLVRHKIDTSPTIREMANNAAASEGDTNSYKLNSEYTAERQVLMQVNNIGLREGMIAGLATFLTLRKAPGIITRYVSRRSARRQQYSSGSSSSYKLDSPNPFQVNKNEAGASSSSSRSSKSSPGMLLLRAVRFTLDVFVSLTVGASTSFYFTDQDYMMSQIANVPLVEGRSLVADEFCSDLIQEFRNIPTEVWRDTQNPALVSVRTFVKNCQYRQSYEAKLRQDYHLQPNEPVSIPSPGVDTSYMMTTMNDARSTANGNSSEDDDDDFYIDGNDPNIIGEDPFASSSPPTIEYFGEEQQQPYEDEQSDNAWAESLVTDQQAKDPRNKSGKEQEKKKRWW